MTPSLISALREVSRWRVYYWKPATMQKLENLGFVEACRGDGVFNRNGHRITDNGRAYLAGLREKAA